MACGNNAVSGTCGSRPGRRLGRHHRGNGDGHLVFRPCHAAHLCHRCGGGADRRG